MNAIVFEHVKVEDLPEAWRAKLAAAPDARVTVRIEEEVKDRAAPGSEQPPAEYGDDPLFGMWRDRELHCDAARQVQIGNAHFSLDLNVDQDGNGSTESVVGYGVNVHVEQPGACTPSGGGRP